MATRKLSQTVCDRHKRPGYLNDGNGLYLASKRNPKTKVITKSWVFRFRDPADRYTSGPSKGLGRLREHGLGSFETFDLEDARLRARHCRKLIAEHKNPIIEAQREKSRQIQEQAKQVTFEWCAQQVIAAKSQGWKNPKNAQQWTNTLNQYAKPINPMLVSDIQTPDVKACLDPIWNIKTETASRLRGRIESILAWATVSGYREEGPNPARWQGHLASTYAAPGLVKKRNREKSGKSAHHASLDYREVGAFMALLRAETSIQARCLELLVLTSVRASEAIQAQWDQFNLEEKYWRIPAVNMKAGKDHLVPLSEQAIELITALPRLDEVYLFPTPRRQIQGQHKSISDAALLNLAKQLQPGITTHGFRSTMMNWAAEQTQHPREVRELALAHTEGSKTIASYLHTDMYVKRAALMKDWNAFCDLPPGHKATVTNIAEAK